jgi:hypothetical protein
MGLVFKHTYSILDIFDNVCGSDKVPTTTLIKLRSPLGKIDNDWNGPWSFNSKQWTKPLKDLPQYKNFNDGSFFMCKEDFDKYFTFINVSRVK